MAQFYDTIIDGDLIISDGGGYTKCTLRVKL